MGECLTRSLAFRNNGGDLHINDRASAEAAAGTLLRLLCKGGP
jgi:hypothetical protein